MSTVQATQTGQTTGTPTRSSKLNSIKPEEFLKIMIQEMQQQDPFEPVSSKDLVNQVAQVRDIQSSLELPQTLKDLAISQKLSSAGAMIGKQVIGKDNDGYDVAGTVTAVKREGDNVFLELDNGQRLAIGNVTSVVNPPAATTPAGTTTASEPAPATGLLNWLLGKNS